VNFGLFFAVSYSLKSSDADWLFREIETGTSPFGLLLLLAAFAPLWLGLWVTMRSLHRRSFRSLIGPDGFRLGDFFKGVMCIAAFMVTAVGIAVVLDVGMVPVANLPLADWTIIMVPALFLIFVQSGAEELLFRGYMQQQLAARTGSTLIAIVLPSIIFGLGHYNPVFGENIWLVVGILTISGLIAADATRRTGNLSFAMGLHFANNVLAILLISVEEPDFPSVSLWVDPTPLTDIAATRIGLLFSVAVMIFIYLTITVFARKSRR